jgi:predicted nucleic acid-binding protein
LSEIRVVLDADFLSAFLKIDRLSLIKDFYQAEYLLIPPAVYREVSLTSLLQKLAGTAWLRVEAPRPGLVEELFHGSLSDDLGAGERESIALVHQHPGAVLLMNDNRARRQAIQLGIEATSIPALLLAFKLSRFLDRDQMTEVIRDLQEKDRYGFRADVLAQLLG